MSSDAPAAIVAELRAEVASQYITYAMNALACYEYLITWEHEYTLMWERKWTASTWMFIANRYLMLFVAISSVPPYTAQSCRSTAVLFDVIDLFPFIIFAVFSALRVFALYDRNRIISGLVLLLNLVPVVFNAYNDAFESVHFADDPILGSFCFGTTTLSPEILLRRRVAYLYTTVTLASRAAVTAADVLVVTITWLKTYRHVKEASQLGVTVSVSAILLRDGSLYFAALLIMNIARVLVDTIPALQSLNPVGYMTTTLQTILVSRFLVNLRHADTPKDTPAQASRLSHFSVPNFRMPTIDSIVGDMGGPLGYGTSGASEELEVGEMDVREVQVVDRLDASSTSGEGSSTELGGSQYWKEGGITETIREAMV